MPIEVSVTDQNVQVSTSGQTVNASVSGGVGPAGPTGATGATGATGPAGTTTWAGITDKPATFAPSTHASSHASAGSDPITVSASQIGSGTLNAARLPSTVVNATAQGEIIRTVAVPAGDDASDYFLIRLSKGTGAGATYFYVVADGTAFLSGSMTIQGGLVVNGTTTVSLGAGSITSGTIATARLGSGTASASTFLRGDGAWAAAGSTSASDLTSGTLPEGRLPNLVIVHPFLLAGM